MDNPRLMRRRERRRQLPHEVGHQRRSEGTGAVYVLGERFSVGPLEREVMQAFGLAVVVGAHDAGMLHPGAVARFPQEAFDRRGVAPQARAQYLRSEEHTSELQSRSDLVCRLLLEKKKKKLTITQHEQSTEDGTCQDIG